MIYFYKKENVKNIDELDDSTVAKFVTVQNERRRGNKDYETDTEFTG